MPEAAPGDRLPGDRVLIRPLVAGGMGTVWVAHDEGKKRDVAVKILAANFEDDDIAKKRFAREAASAMEVQGEHVVQMLDYGVTEHGRPFLVMELLDGQDLEAYLARTGKPLPAPEAASVISQLGQALQRAHDSNILHRDIKPANIFLLPSVDGKQRVKLLDFGFAKKVDRHTGTQLTAEGMIVGTPHYMSPEQMTGVKLDVRSDLFSLGAVAFEAFTGQRPFPGKTLRQIADSIQNRPAPAPTSVDPTLPGALDDWFKKACAREPNDRFGSADEMIAALTEIFAPPPAEAAAPSGSGAKVFVFLLAVIAAAGAAYWFYWR